MKTSICAAALAVLAAPAMAADPGAAVYQSDCQACHQASGQGIKGAFPALAGDRFVTGDPAALTAVVLNGRAGMPSFKAGLTDQEIAAALTYIRHSWGNASGPVTPAAVAAVRARSGAAPAAGAPAH